MITADQIKSLRPTSLDDDETPALLARFTDIRATRQPLFLTAAEVDTILRWKLRSQYERQHRWRLANTAEVIRAVTGVALTITHPEPEYELELRVGLLCTLRGVGVPVASAILTLVYPEEYGVIDFRVWRQVFGKERSMFSISDYKCYLHRIRELAQELGWTVQEVDLAIWEYDKTQAAIEPLLRAGQRDGWKPWVKFFLEGVVFQARDTANRVKHIRNLGCIPRWGQTLGVSRP